MSPGTVLAQARRRAGLTVSEVSQQTRIRESIIRGIEQDDYSACGGDFYARGHIRAMARAVGTDPVPLIEEYDAAQGPPGGPGVGPDGFLEEPDGPGAGNGAYRDPGPGYGPGAGHPPPAEVGLPYQRGGFGPQSTDPGPRHDPGPALQAPAQRISPFDTGNVIPIPADPDPDQPGPPADASRYTFTDPSVAPDPDPGRPGGPTETTPARYTFTDPSAATDPDPGQPGRSAGATPARYTFTDPDAGDTDPGSVDPGPAWPSPPADAAPTTYSFADPSAAPGTEPTVYSFSDPGRVLDDDPALDDNATLDDPGPYTFADPDVAPDNGYGGHSFTDPDATHDGGFTRHYFSDLDEATGDVPGGRFFSEPDVADDEGNWQPRPDWAEHGDPGMGQPEPSGLDALFGGAAAEPPRGGAVTEPRGYPEETAVGGWAAYSAPGGQPAAGPPTSPPPMSPPPRPGTRPGAGRPGAGRSGAGRAGGPVAGRTARRRRPDRMAIILVGLLVVIGVVSYLLLSGSGPAPKPAAGPTTHASASGSPSHHPSPTPTHSSPSPPPSPRVRTLNPASAAAFGPPGGHGDDPQGAPLAIDGRLRTAWNSDWYTTSNFGNLQSGTGLLLNMGRPVTASSVMLNLGATHGASLQIRTGSSPGSLHTVARASGTGNLVRLRLSGPAHIRYLLIWFTALPQDPAGTYQAKVYNVRVRGTS